MDAKTERILKRNYIVVVCESPLELEHIENEEVLGTATGTLAQDIINELTDNAYPGD